MQFNRALVRNAVNLFFTGDPKVHSDLEAVHKALGLSGENPSQSGSHPVILEAARLVHINENYGFVLAPLSTIVKSSVIDGQESKVLADFQTMLGISDCLCLPL